MAALLNGTNWEEIFTALHPGFYIMDPDGWDRSLGGWDASWAEEISLEEFEKRIAVSTCSLPQSLISLWIKRGAP